MRIHDYYREMAGLNLNGSMAALFPPVIIVCVNLVIFQKDQIMLLTIPFLIYSFIGFQLYLHKMKLSLSIEKHIPVMNNHSLSIMDAGNLLVVSMNTRSAKVLLFFPNGQLAGVIKKYQSKGHNRLFCPKLYALYNQVDQAIGFYKIKGKKIAVFDHQKKYLGSLERKKVSLLSNKKGLFNAEGRYIGVVEGAAYYMDEQVFDQGLQQVGRLRRGWMPVHWSTNFPEPNTPVLSLGKELSDSDKLLRLSFLINEYFIER